MMNLPNILTLSRFVFAFFIVLLLMANTFTGHILATILFVAATITDFYDGYLAKKWNLISDFGKIMDPIADKVLLLCIFGVLAHLGMVEWWMVIVIAIREVAVTVSRLKAMQTGRVLAAEFAGKLKTVCQMTTVGVIFLFLIIEQSIWAHSWFYKAEMGWRLTNHILMVISMLLTVGSGVMYFKNNRKK